MKKGNEIYGKERREKEKGMEMKKEEIRWKEREVDGRKCEKK